MRSLVMFVDDQALRPVLLNVTRPGTYLDNLRFTSPFVQSLCRISDRRQFFHAKAFSANDLGKNGGDFEWPARVESATAVVDFCQRDRQSGASCTVSLSLNKAYFPYSRLRRRKFPLRGWFFKVFFDKVGLAKLRGLTSQFLYAKAARVFSIQAGWQPGMASKGYEFEVPSEISACQANIFRRPDQDP